MSQLANVAFVWLVVLGLLALLAISAIPRVWRALSSGLLRYVQSKSDREIAQILRDANDALTNRPRRRSNRK